MPASTPPRPSKSIALAATALCLLAVVAAVVAFVNGNWFGIAWVLLAGVTSNMAWYHWRRLRATQGGEQAQGGGPGAEQPPRDGRGR
ncbi:hypothetical protein E4198_20340 [Streptomyces sp. RKND-216]|uniref:hypothetical protein n=1 Tax=Streptomyces sp. RKND-216 TaxID=2562581 RepID=UPI00109DB9E0|nr:hypothetical protein [Streptomyces sp. RKND-216]THA26702.1 hypothetical protein E4198_20340 [Streptomyces sp. RKND-216]